jgi:hypothetical protein
VTSLRCSTADVEHFVRVQFLRDGEVSGQVVARSVEGVVDLRQARVGEDRVGHATTVSVVCSGQLGPG